MELMRNKRGIIYTEDIPKLHMLALYETKNEIDILFEQIERHYVLLKCVSSFPDIFFI